MANRQMSIDSVNNISERDLIVKTYFTEKYSLTTRELDALCLLVAGYTNKEIGEQLNISSHTVKAHVSSLLNKFSETSRVALAVKIVKLALTNNFDI